MSKIYLSKEIQNELEILFKYINAADEKSAYEMQRQTFSYLEPWDYDLTFLCYDESAQIQQTLLLRFIAAGLIKEVEKYDWYELKQKIKGNWEF